MSWNFVPSNEMWAECVSVLACADFWVGVLDKTWEFGDVVDFCEY